MLSIGIEDERACSEDSGAKDGVDGRPSIRLENLFPLTVVTVGDGDAEDVVLVGVCEEDEGPRCIAAEIGIKSVDRGVSDRPCLDSFAGGALEFVAATSDRGGGG